MAPETVKEKPQLKKDAKTKRPKAVQFQGWLSTDEQEVERRCYRGKTDPLHVKPLEESEPIFGSFNVSSESGSSYRVEIRSLEARINSCNCPDYEVSALGTCKHIEAVLHYLYEHEQFDFTDEESQTPSPSRVEVFLRYYDGDEQPAVCVIYPEDNSDVASVRKLLNLFFSSKGSLFGKPVSAMAAIRHRLSRAPDVVKSQIRVSTHIEPWLQRKRRATSHCNAKKQFLADVEAGKRSFKIVKYPLYPYQEEGALHLAFNERALLADEMGLGKTVQAIAACELLRRLRGIERVLVVCPASLKAEWEEQIAKFTGLPSLVIQGPRHLRQKMYDQSSFFYLTNYEQIRNDYEVIQNTLAPDVIILDEAQRIKNWKTKTAWAVKQLKSHYAFVLTGTPIENRIDEIYSIMQFIDPHIFGPLFRFNRDFYELDDRGKATGYKNLSLLHRRLHPALLRRRKGDIEEQLPPRTVNNYFVEMSEEQQAAYDEENTQLACLMGRARKRPLLPEEMKKLHKLLACMRMLCDTPYILDPDCRVCPKLDELKEILPELCTGTDNKIIIFSEWERMLQLIRDLADDMDIEYAWHTGTVPQHKRREEINRFKEDPDCRLFLSTDSGSVGLNLQVANVVINMDLPWNPAKLEQRIARAWRKHQSRPVQVINLVSENTIEHRMIGMLSQKQALADGVLDGADDLDSMALPSGRAAMVERLGALMGVDVVKSEEEGGEKAEKGEGDKEGKEQEKEEETPSQRYEGVKDEMIARFSDRVQLLENHENEQGAKALVAVVDKVDDNTQKQVDEVVESHFQGNSESSESPELFVLDDDTYNTIQKLIEAGVLQVGDAKKNSLFKSPAMERSSETERERRTKEAKKCLGDAERKMKMAVVLSVGGFPVEAIEPAGEALELGCKCLKTLEGGRGKSHELITDEVIALSRLCADCAGVTKEEAESRTKQVETFITHVGETLSQAALGG